MSRDSEKRERRLPARRRIELLLDPGSFIETDALLTHRCEDFGLAERKVPGDGLVTGSGTIDGRRVYVVAQDFSVFGGSVSEAGAAKACKTMDQALQNGSPLISLNDGGGARIQEGVASVGGYAEIAWRTMRASGVVPQVSAIMGACAGGASYVASMNDFLFMVEGSAMFVTGPEVIRSVTGQQSTKEELGGAATHARQTGIAHFRVPDDTACVLAIRRLLSYLPSNNLAEAPWLPSDEPAERPAPELDEMIPASPQAPYDMKKVLQAVFDADSFLEVQAEFARNMIVGFARLAGRPVGVVANQPQHLAGALDIAASLKASRFVRFLDAFQLPIVTFVDAPGYLPGVQEELGGIIRHGAKLLYAYGEATAPTVTVVVRKAYGGAYGVMGSKHLHTDLSFAWPSAEVAVMGAEAAVKLLYRRELAAADDKEAEMALRVEEYRAKFSNPFSAAERGFIDAVIRPRETRRHLARALLCLAAKRSSLPPRKHPNLPL